MALTVSLQGNENAEGNPYIDQVGRANSEAVILYSGVLEDNRKVVYQIVRKDYGSFDGINNNTVLNIPYNFGRSELIKSVSITALTIILPFRTEFRARVSIDNGFHFGNGLGSKAYTNERWVDFKTRDKTYSIPDSLTELRINQQEVPSGAVITVTNYGKATVTTTNRGARVDNRDRMCNDVSSIRDTSTGVIVTNRTIERASATGVTVGS